MEENDEDEDNNDTNTIKIEEIKEFSEEYYETNERSKLKYMQDLSKHIWNINNSKLNMKTGTSGIANQGCNGSLSDISNLKLISQIIDDEIGGIGIDFGSGDGCVCLLIAALTNFVMYGVECNWQRYQNSLLLQKTLIANKYEMADENSKKILAGNNYFGNAQFYYNGEKNKENEILDIIVGEADKYETIINKFEGQEVAHPT